MKFIIISGGVISGIGKGITAASVSYLLQSAGYTVTPVKNENYLNMDAGTINPIEHGDPFLCEDGTEADMDIGHYEKFLDKNLGKKNFITMGQIYQTVIDKERRFEYNGEDVEAIPYITDEIQKRWISAGKSDNADFVVIELGGTAGEYQNIFYYEASRILSLKLPNDVIHIHVGYMPTPAHLGEPKTKPIQLSVRTLNSMGIQPDFIVVRSKDIMDERRKNRLALFCNIHANQVISTPNTSTVYAVPLVMKAQCFDYLIQEKLNLKKTKRADTRKLEQFIKKIGDISRTKKEVKIAIVGKYFKTGDFQLRDSYAALLDAIAHASWYHGYTAKTIWINAETVEKKGIVNAISEPVDGIIVPIGWGARGSEGMIQAASFSRKNKIPYLGLCYGMQLAVVSFARDKLNLKNANTVENDPNTKYPVIHLMPAQEKYVKERKYGGTMRLGAWEAIVKKGTVAYESYDTYGDFINKASGLTTERHRHRYEFNDRYKELFEKAGMVFSARSVKEKLVEIMELPKNIHPFYVGTQGHPEYKSRPMHPHPLFLSFLKACVDNKQ
jgi:CTP synthase